jgi:hypothetical protein
VFSPKLFCSHAFSYFISSISLSSYFFPDLSFPSLSITDSSKCFFLSSNQFESTVYLAVENTFDVSVEKRKKTT